jgi:hypothetical protein
MVVTESGWCVRVGRHVYGGGQFYCWRKQENSKKTTDLSQVVANLTTIRWWPGRALGIDCHYILIIDFLKLRNSPPLPLDNWRGVWVAQWVRSLDLTTHTSLSPIRRGFVPTFVNYKKGCTRLAAAIDKVYQLLAYQEGEGVSSY